MKADTVVPISAAARSIMALASALVRKLIRDDSLAMVADMAVTPDFQMPLLYVRFTHRENSVHPGGIPV